MSGVAEGKTSDGGAARVQALKNVKGLTYSVLFSECAV